MSSVLYWIVLVGLMLGVWYLLMIRPQRKRTREHDTLTKELGRGSRVITVGGIYGEVDSVGEDTVVLKLEDGARMKVAKGGIAGLQETK
jgi:preprotein translocase subunit YajC